MATPTLQGISQRQRKVGETIRHALAREFLERTGFQPPLEQISITVAEVRMSPDLRLATAFVMPLGSVLPAGIATREEFIALLKEYAPRLRQAIAREVHLRYVPELRFRYDTTLDEVAKIDALLRQPSAESTN
jgi:ribosome-binding factor A